jgi:hypothetical protein
MDKEYKLSGSEEMGRREGKAEEFFRALLEAEERPYFVSDEATLYDIFVGDEAELNDRCEAHYGVRLKESDFKIPLWRLLDELEARRRS